MISLGLGFYEYSFLHLMTHAMFKSLLFLCAGVFIHSIGDIQDIRILGGLTISCPVTSIYFTVSSIALCGFPFLSGFYSKDVILEVYFLGGSNIFILFIIFMSTMLTLTYRVRLMYYIFFNNMGGKSIFIISEDAGMAIPISLLVIFSVVAGG
jgi:NADH-ubiquinone oxidoreductase chain 5